MKKQKKKKKPKITTLKNKLWKIFSLYIRIKDCLRTTGNPERGYCISCGKLYPIKKLQAGHFMAGRHNSNLFYERGCHAQCVKCNVFLAGNILDYMDAIIKLYGKKIINELRKNEAKRLKFTIKYLEDKVKLYTKKTEKLLEK